MPSFDMFSKRQKKLRGEAPDVYTYDKIPHPLRVQVVHIWQDAFGNIDAYESQAGQVCKYIYDILCREYGVFFWKAISQLFARLFKAECQRSEIK